MKNKKTVIMSVTLKTFAMCFFAVVLTLATIFVCNILNANRLKNAFQKTAKSVESKWNVQTSKLPIPDFNINEPFTVNAKTNIAEDKTIDVSASYKPGSERMSAQAVFRNSVGEVAGLYAYCNQNRAGISFDDSNNTFYTFPASEFKKTAGTVITSALDVNLDNINLNEISKKILNPLKNPTVKIDKELLIKELLKLYSCVEWDKDTNINLFLKNPVYKFKIQCDNINEFLKAVCKPGITGYEFADNAVKKWVEKITELSPDGYYNFSVNISDGKITQISCITPEIANRVFKIKMTVSSDGSDISLLVTDEADLSTIFGISIEIFEGKIGVSVDYGNSKGFVLNFDADGKISKLEAGIVNGKNVSYKLVSQKDKSVYNLNFSVKKDNIEQNIDLELLNNYNEFCNAQKKCSMDDANLYELYCLGREFEKLRNVVGI